MLTDRQTNKWNYTNFERNLAMMVIYPLVKFEFDWTKRFWVFESGNGNADGQTDVGHINLIGGLVTCNPPKNWTKDHRDDCKVISSWTIMLVLDLANEVQVTLWIRIFLWMWQWTWSPAWLYIRQQMESDTLLFIFSSQLICTDTSHPVAFEIASN